MWRCGSVKRVAGGPVGEGSTVVSAIHAWLSWRQRVVPT